MATLTSWQNTDKFNVLRDKTNAIVTAVNEISGGNLNQRLVKDSGSDFDYTFTNGELWLNSATSVNLGSLTVGGGVTLAVPYNTLNSESGLKVRVYSSAGSGNYFVGLVTSTGPAYGTTNIGLTVTKIGGSGTFTDWIIVPYFVEEEDKQNVVVTTFPNNIFTTRSLGGFTLDYQRIGLVKKGNLVTISGNVTATATVDAKDISQIFATVLSKYTSETNETFYGSCTVTVDTSPLIVQTGSCSIYNGLIEFQFYTGVASLTDISDRFSWSFNLTYRTNDV
jgi:hypothetical protein